MTKRSIKIKQNNSSLNITDNKNVNQKKKNTHKKLINAKWKDDQRYMYIRHSLSIIIKRCMGMDFLLQKSVVSNFNMRI